MSTRMSRGCYEETASVEFKLNAVDHISADFGVNSGAKFAAPILALFSKENGLR